MQPYKDPVKVRDRLRDLEKRGVMTSVIESQYKHRKPARCDDLLTVETWINQLERLKIEFHYQIMNESMEWIAEARPQALPEDIFRLLAQKTERISERPSCS